MSRSAPVSSLSPFPNVPAAGPVHTLPGGHDVRIDWSYRLEDPAVRSLYEKGKAATWNATTGLDWSRAVDLERLFRGSDGAPASGFNAIMQPPRALSDDEVVAFQSNVHVWMLSQFLHGEQGGLLACAKLVETLPTMDFKLYAANQAADEARHVEVFRRYLDEKLGDGYAVSPEMQTLLAQVLGDRRWDMTLLCVQVLIEGLGLAAFRLVRTLSEEEPLLCDITRRLMEDEARHVAFGVLVLERVYRGELTSAELREREEFVIEAIRLLHDRLLFEQVFERLGWPAGPWLAWARATPFMRAFRQLLFARVIPVLKRVGLWTPGVSRVLQSLDLLQFENDRDVEAASSELDQLVAALHRAAA
jgi:hypothetical protein